MRLFDSHCHLEEWMIPEILASDTKRVVNIGCDETSSIESVEWTKKYDFVYGTVGIHPECADTCTPALLDKLALLAANEKIKAIGEIGLDYHWEKNPPREIQRECFNRQIALAIDLGLPICIHSRDADRETFDLLKESGAFLKTKVLMHCYSGSAELAKEYLKQGAWISIAGPVTYKNNRKTVEVAAMLPEGRFLIETDSPYLSPVPLRGKPNSPANVVFTAMRIAEIRGEDLEHIAEASYKNACEFYGIDD